MASDEAIFPPRRNDPETIHALTCVMWIMRVPLELIYR
jgi:hypothetical protein